MAIELPAGLVVVTGPNGAGKTSLLEGLVLACLGVSPRTSRDLEAISRGARALRVTLDLDGPSGPQRRLIALAPGQPRRLAVDDRPHRSVSSWRARGSLLVFLPDELRAVKGPPAARRRHLDRLLEAREPGYLENLTAYQAALAQRNALLRRVRAGLTGAGALDAWDGQLAELGAAIVLARRAAIARLGEPFTVHLERLGGGGPGRLLLEPSPPDLAEAADAEVLGLLAAELTRRRDADLRAAQTLAGPHRDDLLVAAGQLDLRRFGSQGEQRTAVLALLLAHRDDLAAVGAQPIMILDDVLSELDPLRRELLLNALGDDGQSFVTSADPGTVELARERARLLVRVDGGVVLAS